MPGEVGIYAYAVDPAVINSWDRFLRIFGGAGYGKGRVIAAIPSRNAWKRSVIEVCHARLKTTQRAALEERFRRSRHKFYEVPAELDLHGDWPEQALKLVDEIPLALVVGEESSDDVVRPPNDLDPDEPPWRVMTSGLVSRTVEAMDGLCCMFLRQSKRIRIVDPYLDVKGRIFRRLFERVWEGSEPNSVELHCSTKTGDAAFIEEHLRGCIPAGLSVTVQLWKLAPESSRPLHDRLLVSDLGGIQVGYGFKDAASGEESVTHASLMEDDAADTWAKKLRSPSTAFEEDGDAFKVWGEKC